MNELTRESCLCHWGFKKGEERPGHKYFARIASAIPGRFRYFYSKSEYDAYKNGTRKSNVGWYNNLHMTTTQDQATKYNEQTVNQAKQTYRNKVQSMANDIKRSAIKKRLNDLKNLTQTSERAYRERSLQDKDLRNQHLRELNELRKQNTRELIARAKEKIKEIKQQNANIMVSELSEPDKKTLIDIGKSSAKYIIKETIGNVLLSEITGLGLMIDRATKNATLRNRLELNDPYFRKNTRIKPARQTTYQKR